jgi:signal transduction histidine kinase
MRVEPVDVSQLVQDMMELLRSSIGPQIPIVTQLAPTALKAITDPHQLELAILNLAVNARDAMPLGGTITITTSRREEAGSAHEFAPGTYIVIAVSDTGSGMDEDTLSRAREPFFTT